MQNPAYFLTLTAAYSGILAGIIIASKVKEELKEGMKYFIMLQKACIIISASILLNFFGLSLILRLLSYTAIIGAFAIIKKINNSILYAALALMFFAASKNPNTFFMMSAAIFIIGLSTGGIMAAEKMKAKFKDLAIMAIRETFVFAIIAAIIGIFL